MTDTLKDAYPILASRLQRISIADLPTPVETKPLSYGGQTREVIVKRDDITGTIYGGNKVRKLEYLLQRAVDHNANRVATFGTVASNHALATAIYASQAGLDCTAFLSHQTRTEAAAKALNMHLKLGSEIIRFGGSRSQRIATLRRNLRGRSVSLIPMGGSSWVGTIGFVAAGLELSEQIRRHDIEHPDRIYMPMGTMGSVAGLALGLALAGIQSDVQAVRVTHTAISNADLLDRLLQKTSMLMRRFDDSIPDEICASVRITIRESFFGEGYARTNEITDDAIAIADEQLGLTLEATYTGKTMAALLHDLDRGKRAPNAPLFWNTYNSRPLDVSLEKPDDTTGLPEEFLRYFD